MKTMLISFKPHIYEKIASGEKIFEHRRSFPEGAIKAYMYVSRPVCAITGIVFLDNRHSLKEWREEFSYDSDAVRRINEYLKKTNYAAEIKEFHETNKVPLSKLREDIDTFVVPQMYYFIDGKSLLGYLEKEIQTTGKIITHDFSEVESDLICRH